MPNTSIPFPRLIEIASLLLTVDFLGTAVFAEST
jgi:hypothetical protein